MRNSLQFDGYVITSGTVLLSEPGSRASGAILRQRRRRRRCVADARQGFVVTDQADPGYAQRPDSAKRREVTEHCPGCGNQRAGYRQAAR